MWLVNRSLPTTKHGRTWKLEISTLVPFLYFFMCLTTFWVSVTNSSALTWQAPTHSHTSFPTDDHKFECFSVMFLTHGSPMIVIEVISTFVLQCVFFYVYLALFVRFVPTYVSEECSLLTNNDHIIWTFISFLTLKTCPSLIFSMDEANIFKTVKVIKFLLQNTVAWTLLNMHKKDLKKYVMNSKMK